MEFLILQWMKGEFNDANMIGIKEGEYANHLVMQMEMIPGHLMNSIHGILKVTMKLVTIT